VSDGLQHWKGKTLRSHLCRLVLASEIYNLWRNRNALSHGDLPKTEEQVVRQIKCDFAVSVFGLFCYC
jgi:hypothetical protein